MALKFVEKLPEGAKSNKNTNKVFTNVVIDALRENPGKWALIPEASAQGAAAFVKRMSELGETFVYSTVDTGKPASKSRKTHNGSGTYTPTIKDVYVKFNG